MLPSTPTLDYVPEVVSSSTGVNVSIEIVSGVTPIVGVSGVAASSVETIVAELISTTEATY